MSVFDILTADAETVLADHFGENVVYTPVGAAAADYTCIVFRPTDETVIEGTLTKTCRIVFTSTPPAITIGKDKTNRDKFAVDGRVYDVIAHDGELDQVTGIHEEAMIRKGQRI